MIDIYTKPSSAKNSIKNDIEVFKYVSSEFI